MGFDLSPYSCTVRRDVGEAYISLEESDVLHRAPMDSNSINVLVILMLELAFCITDLGYTQSDTLMN